jgi:hypothetical protein
MIILHRSLLTALFLLLSSPALPQTLSSDVKREKVIKFLSNFTAQHNKHAAQSGGLAVEFTGDFELLPNGLEQSLLASFPNHRFVIAKMLKFHNNWAPVVLLIVTDNNSGEPVAFAWDLTFDNASDSFRGILSSYQAMSKKDALSKVRALSELLVLSGHGRVGEVKSKSGSISSELYFYTEEHKPWRVLRVSLDKQLRFGRITLINPKSGEDDSEIPFPAMPDNGMQRTRNQQISYYQWPARAADAGR